MKKVFRETSISIGIADGVIVFLLPILFYIFSGEGIVSDSKKLFTHFLPYLAFMFPLACFIGWRGKLDAERIQTGKATFYRPFIEGFIIGFMVMFFTHALTLTRVALASGTIYDGVLYEPTNLERWLELLLFILQMGIIVGVASSIFFFGLHLLNRLLLKAIRAS